MIFTKSKKQNKIMFAYIYIPKTKKYRTVRTTDIFQFDINNYDSKIDIYKKNTDKLILPDGKKQICQILKLGDTEAALKQKINEKRVRVQKLTTSIIHDNEESVLNEEKENEINNVAKRRKINQEVRNKSKKETDTFIIAAYVSASKQQLLQSGADDNSEECTTSDDKEDECWSNNLRKEKQRRKEKQGELHECLQKLKYAEDRARYSGKSNIMPYKNLEITILQKKQEKIFLLSYKRSATVPFMMILIIMYVRMKIIKIKLTQ